MNLLGNLEIILLVCLSIILIELFFYMIVKFVNKKFQWLITKNDECPKLSEEGIEKFFKHGFDSELGWIRKPNTSHTEQGKYGETKWHTNKIGARINPEFDNKKSKISCYGDSFTFCRQVNDDETWEYELSKILNTNVINYGVGNYGIDQTLIRLKREFVKNPTEIVIIGIVPDTISRIMSIWRHYYEYGNTFGFKPRFILKNKKLCLIKNIINDKKKFFTYEKYLIDIRKNDFFYKEKFRKEEIHFPHIITIFKNPSRNFRIIFWVLLIEFLKKINKDVSKIEWNPNKIIMKINLMWRINLYKNKEVQKLLKEIILNMVNFSKKSNFKLYLVFLPQKDDILFIKNNFHFYKEFIEELTKNNDVKIIDLAKNLQYEDDIDELYSDNNEYGGHYSKNGNKKIALGINSELRKDGII